MQEAIAVSHGDLLNHFNNNICLRDIQKQSKGKSSEFNWGTLEVSNDD